MNTRNLPACALLLVLTNLPGCASKSTPEAAPQTTATLVDTYWRLGQVGKRVITTPAGAQDIYFVMQADNQRVSGYSGCNRMMGSYALNGSRLRFDQMAGTRMACLGEGMKIEQEFLDIFPRVTGWEISGQTLRLLDSGGQALANFQARAQSEGARPD